MARLCVANTRFHQLVCGNTAIWWSSSKALKNMSGPRDGIYAFCPYQIWELIRRPALAAGSFTDLIVEEL